MRSPISFLPRRVVGALATVVALGALAMWGPLAAADEIDDLRAGIPTGEDVRSEISVLSLERDNLLTELNSAESDLTETLLARDLLDDDQRRLTAQIEAATDSLRAVAVRSFVTGGDVGELELLVNVTDVSELSWRRHLIRNHAGSSQVALVRLRELEAQASDEVRASIDAAIELRRRIAGLEIDITALEPQIAAARELEPLADAWDRAVIAIEEGSYGIAPADKWERLRFCESTHNYQALSETGKYRGAYQFDLATWQTVGGTGDPVAAPDTEQDARARELYARRGHEPWPECGHHLR